MAQGVLLFKGMKVGFLPGDLVISCDPTGGFESKAILSTAYNVIPVWLRVARDNAMQAKRASDRIAQEWSTDDVRNRELLVGELECCLQVFVSCGIALDALYDQLRPFARITAADIQAWKENGTGRAKQIAEVLRRVFNLNGLIFKQFRHNLTEIIKYRDLAVHPSLELKQACPRPDLPVGVDWKFAAYRSQNSEACLSSTISMFGYLYEHPCENQSVTTSMEDVFAALRELGVVTLKEEHPTGA